MTPDVLKRQALALPAGFDDIVAGHVSGGAPAEFGPAARCLKIGEK